MCNLSCVHHNVNAGPTGDRAHGFRRTIETVLEVIRQRGIQVLDLTGGALEMNLHFRYLVREARAMGVEVIDRCNLTILLDGYQGSS